MIKGKVMVSKKKQKPSSKVSSSKSSRISYNVLFYGFSVVLLLSGQALIFKQSLAGGIILSVFGLGLAALGYFNVNLNDIAWSSFFVSKSPTASDIKPRSQKNSKPQKTAVTFEKEKNLTPTGIIRTILILIAVILGVKGQILLSDMGHAEIDGLKYYFGGVVLFLFSLWPWKREKLKFIPLSPTVEWTLFALIFILAAFLRIYKLDTIPSGIFFDMGFQGYGALKVLHEGWRPFNLDVGPNFPSAPIPLYIGALWFIFFKNTQFCLNLFYVAWGLASLPLIYWTFRQLSGPRIALLALYILAVMRWNITFCRNSFPPAMIPFFMFGTIAFLLYGLRTSKKWPFVLAGLLFALGLYSYQSYMLFPLAVVLLGFYECVNNWKAVKANALMLIVFSLIFLAVGEPIIWPLLKGQQTGRAAEVSIVSRVKQSHSIEPFIDNLHKTALMFNRRGDPNPRHNLQDHRQLDDVTGFLFFFGFFYILARCWRRKYFYTLTGLAVMSLPCLITIDPAHSSRMYGMTPFVAFASASFLSAIWSRLYALGGKKGEIIFLILLTLPLAEMARENYHTYFVEQAGNVASWGEFSIAETTIGKHFAQYGDKYDCYVSPRYYGFFTINYLAYFQQDHIFRLDLPLTPAKMPAPGRGLYFALEEGRTGVLDLLKTLYPGGEAEVDNDPNGSPFIYFFRVPPEEIDKIRGLKMESFKSSSPLQAAAFPQNLPQGPYRASFTGELLIDRSGVYEWNVSKNGGLFTWSIGGHPVLPGSKLNLAKGFYRVKMNWNTPAGPPVLSFSYTLSTGEKGLLTSQNFNSLSYDRGLKGSYYVTSQPKVPVLVQWDPVINFINGNDFSYPLGNSMIIRWTGHLKAPKTGAYVFSAQSSGTTEIRLDTKPVSPNKPEAYLTEGFHSLEVTYHINAGWGGNCNLSWLVPGAKKLEIIPNQYFGESQ